MIVDLLNFIVGESVVGESVVGVLVLGESALRESFDHGSRSYYD